ncbi:hypothetical protein CCHR01_14325 [Colletotrichum chrysophilum]|uniref:Uncharacterized protein n=1 Tax=Colletotrichum chrysophilum TaxID=1836956 RepID=A0AAD9ECV5_9PEZI|nr:hypothetical protein CCHR01_14325 [Colletotrichum chrysophilum]
MWETMFESHAAVDQGATAVVHNTGSRASLHPWTSLDPWALTLPPSLSPKGPWTPAFGGRRGEREEGPGLDLSVRAASKTESSREK